MKIQSCCHRLCQILAGFHLPRVGLMEEVDGWECAENQNMGWCPHGTSHIHGCPLLESWGAGVPAERTSAELVLKLQLIHNLKYWSLYSVGVVVFRFCDPHESFTNHCVFHIFSGLFLAVSLWDNPFLAGHNSQRGKSHSSLFLATCIFCLTLVPQLLNTPSTSGKNKLKIIWIIFPQFDSNHLTDHSACAEEMRLSIQQNVLSIQLFKNVELRSEVRPSKEAHESWAGGLSCFPKVLICVPCQDGVQIANFCLT